MAWNDLQDFCRLRHKGLIDIDVNGDAYITPDGLDHVDVDLILETLL